MRSRIAALVAVLCVLTAGAAPAQDAGTRIRTRSYAEARTVSQTRNLPAGLLKVRPPAASPTPRAGATASAEVLPGVSVPVRVPGHEFGLGEENPAPVSQRVAFRVGAEADQASWALAFLPHQPDLRDSVVQLFGSLARHTAEFPEARGFRELAESAARGESPAVLMSGHRDLLDSLGRRLASLGGERKWYYDLGYSSQHLRMVLFFERQGMVSQGLAAVKVLAGEISVENLDPPVRAALGRLTSREAPRERTEDRELRAELDRLIALF